MRTTVLCLALLLQAAAAAPALAQGCDNPCGKNQIYSPEEGRCVPITPMV